MPSEEIAASPIPFSFFACRTRYNSAATGSTPFYDGTVGMSIEFDGYLNCILITAAGTRGCLSHKRFFRGPQGIPLLLTWRNAKRSRPAAASCFFFVGASQVRLKRSPYLCWSRYCRGERPAMRLNVLLKWEICSKPTCSEIDCTFSRVVRSSFWASRTRTTRIYSLK